MSSTGDRKGHNAQDNYWQQFVTTPTLNNAVHWLYRPCSAPSWFKMVEKAIYESRLGHLLPGAWYV